MATDNALPITLGVIAIVAMPGAVAAVICADDMVDAMRQKARRVRQSLDVQRIRDTWQEQRTLDRLEQAFAPAPPAGPPWIAAARVASEAMAAARDNVAQFAAVRLNAVGLAPAWLPAAAGPALPTGPALPAMPFEQVVAQLRELRSDRQAAGADRDTFDDAYDQALRAACQCLDIAEHLDELSGLDREIERVRVEGALVNAGVMFTEC